jgi:hypothetical protein
MATLRLNRGQTVIQRNRALGHRFRVRRRSATRHLNPGIWAEESLCSIKLPEFETLVALKSHTARQSERGEGPTFSFVMQKGRSIASAKCDWPQAAGFFHCIGIGLRALCARLDSMFPDECPWSASTTSLVLQRTARRLRQYASLCRRWAARQQRRCCSASQSACAGCQLSFDSCAADLCGAQIDCAGAVTSARRVDSPLCLPDGYSG